MTGPDVSVVVLSISTGVAAALAGCFALMRRMSLAADALSHVALPGIGLAIALRIHPALGGVAALLLGAVVVWGVERKTQLANETVIGVVFSTALAAGTLLTSGEELIEALLGGTGKTTTAETLVSLVVAASVVVFFVRERHRLVLALVSPDIARTAGIDVARLDLKFLLVFALTIALGLRYLGVLLIGSLAIIPAATARRLARDLRGMLLVAIAVSLVATTAGSCVAALLHREPGPIVVLCAAACFFASLAARSRK